MNTRSIGFPKTTRRCSSTSYPYGFIPGRRVKLTEAAPYRGVIKLECNGDEVVVGYEVAERIWLRQTD